MRAKEFVKENSLSLFFLVIFLLALIGQAIAGHSEFNDEQADHGGSPISFWRYVSSSAYGVAVMENWQSEYLQFFLYIFATVWLVQRGSSESKEPGQEGTESDEEQKVGRHADDDSPAWARAGGWRTAVFSRSLGMLMGALFLLTWAASSG